MIRRFIKEEGENGAFLAATRGIFFGTIFLLIFLDDKKIFPVLFFDLFIH